MDYRTVLDDDISVSLSEHSDVHPSSGLSADSGVSSNPSMRSHSPLHLPSYQHELHEDPLLGSVPHSHSRDFHMGDADLSSSWLHQAHSVPGFTNTSQFFHQPQQQPQYVARARPVPISLTPTSSGPPMQAYRMASDPSFSHMPPPSPTAFSVMSYAGQMPTQAVVAANPVGALPVPARPANVVIPSQSYGVPARSISVHIPNSPAPARVIPVSPSAHQSMAMGMPMMATAVPASPVPNGGVLNSIVPMRPRGSLSSISPSPSPSHSPNPFVHSLSGTSSYGGLSSGFVSAPPSSSSSSGPSPVATAASARPVKIPLPAALAPLLENPSAVSNEDMRRIWESNGLHGVKIPDVDGKGLHVGALLACVNDLGGIHYVRNHKKWTNVAETLGIPLSEKGFMNKFKRFYAKYVAPFERRTLMASYNLSEEDIAARSWAKASPNASPSASPSPSASQHRLSASAPQDGSMNMGQSFAPRAKPAALTLSGSMPPPTPALAVSTPTNSANMYSAASFSQAPVAATVLSSVPPGTPIVPASPVHLSGHSYNQQVVAAVPVAALPVSSPPQSPSLRNRAVAAYPQPGVTPANFVPARATAVTVAGMAPVASPTMRASAVPALVPSQHMLSAVPAQVSKQGSQSRLLSAPSVGHAHSPSSGSGSGSGEDDDDDGSSGDTELLPANRSDRQSLSSVSASNHSASGSSNSSVGSNSDSAPPAMSPQGKRKSVSAAMTAGNLFDKKRTKSFDERSVMLPPPNRLYLVERDERDALIERKYTVLDSHGERYVITIASQHKCTCQEFCRMPPASPKVSGFPGDPSLPPMSPLASPFGFLGQQYPSWMCKHIFFVLSKVLRVPRDSRVMTQPTLASSELLEIYSNAPPNPAHSVIGVMSGILAEVTRRERRREKELFKMKKETPRANTDSVGADLFDMSAMDGLENELDEDIDLESMFGYSSKCSLAAECTLCYESFGSERLTYCVSKCGNNFHRVCFQVWAAQFQDDSQIVCPLCRVPWQDMEKDKYNSESNGSGLELSLSHLSSKHPMDHFDRVPPFSMDSTMLGSSLPPGLTSDSFFKVTMSDVSDVAGRLNQDLMFTPVPPSQNNNANDSFIHNNIFAASPALHSSGTQYTSAGPIGVFGQPIGTESSGPVPARAIAVSLPGLSPAPMPAYTISSANVTLGQGNSSHQHDYGDTSMPPVKLIPLATPFSSLKGQVPQAGGDSEMPGTPTHAAARSVGSSPAKRSHYDASQQE